jgi:hypothetical protein
MTRGKRGRARVANYSGGVMTSPQVIQITCDRYLRDLNASNPLGMGGELAQGFGRLMQLLWQVCGWLGGCAECDAAVVAGCGRCGSMLVMSDIRVSSDHAAVLSWCV